MESAGAKKADVTESVVTKERIGRNMKSKRKDVREYNATSGRKKMTFGEKLKNLRGQNGITQDELAEKLYVTRTAVSKWENDRGLPTIDTMKQIAELFGVTLDELVSDDDVRSARLADERAAKRFRIPALVCLAAAFALAFLTAYVSKWCSLPLIACTGGFIGCALLSRPAYKRRASRENAATYIVSRIAIAAIFLLAATTLLLKLF